MTEPADPHRRASVAHALGLTRWMCAGYGALLVALLGVRFLIGDRSPLLFAINSLLLYGFAPVPLVMAVAIALRRVDALAVSALGAAAWCALWGGLFVPRGEQAAEPSLVVLSYNALGFDHHPADALAVIRDSAADLVMLQELNPETAAAIERELAVRYPYRWLEPHNGTTGGGILSRYPLRPERSRILAEAWPGAPMVATLDFSGRSVTLVRFHAAAGPALFKFREAQAHALADFVLARKGPSILAGDLNATDQNGAYAIMTERLHDAWREAGWGFGHTFPGEPTPAHGGGSRPVILGVPVPMWLVRIDYVFHSDEFRATSARLATYAGGSDHRGLIARLTLR